MAVGSLRRWVAEIAGTALLVGIGTGSIVAAGRLGGEPQWTLAVAWFLAVLVPILAFAKISGAHLNPAVTLALALSGRMPRGLVLGYWASQFLGAFAGSGLVWAMLGPGSDLGATVPHGISLAGAFVAEGAFTALLVGTVFLLSDRGPGEGSWRLLLPPAAVGVSTYVIGPWTGSSLNPARTIAPAVLSGTYTDLVLYLVAVPLFAIAVALVWPEVRRTAPAELRAAADS